MGIDFDTFYDWCKDRFGERNLKIRRTAHGDEICTHSPFAIKKLGKEDQKFHLWLNPSGGKNNYECGVYRCWLTDEMGSLISFVSEIDNISYDEAEELIIGISSLRSLERKVHDLFGNYEEHIPVKQEQVVKTEEDKLKLPESCYLIETMFPNDYWKIRATKYLKARKIPSVGLYVCTNNKEYGNRIIIPWYDKNGELIFWNGRSMSPKDNILRYAKPKKADQSSALYMTAWPEKGAKIYIMEGEFDAISLSLANLTGCACGGKYLSETQIDLLRDYTIVLAFDADEGGREAMLNIGRELLEQGFKNLSYVRPPTVYKDWNKLLQVRNIQTLNAYVHRFEKPFTTMTADLLLSRKLSN
jgi:DNA primase